MSDTIGKDELVAMLRCAVEQVRANHEMLSKLDSFGGDGDHGTTMARGMGLIEKAVDEASGRDLKTLLDGIAWAIMGVDGGATGPLLGMLFMGMAEAVEGKDALDGASVAAMFEAGLASLQKHTKAKVGDKTMMDALVPAVEALRQAADAGADVAAALERAAEAAARGAQATTDMQARFGRARSLGEGSKGHPDPGATSMTLIFKGFAQALRSSP
jgi:dihydroxyacetone kinase-like protein